MAWLLVFFIAFFLARKLAIFLSRLYLEKKAEELEVSVEREERIRRSRWARESAESEEIKRKIDKARADYEASIEDDHEAQVRAEIDTLTR